MSAAMDSRAYHQVPRAPSAVRGLLRNEASPSCIPNRSAKAIPALAVRCPTTGRNRAWRDMSPAMTARLSRMRTVSCRRSFGKSSCGADDGFLRTAGVPAPGSVAIGEPCYAVPPPREVTRPTWTSICPHPAVHGWVGCRAMKQLLVPLVLAICPAVSALGPDDAQAQRAGDV